MIRYIGIDPGSQTGLVILDEEGQLLKAETLKKPGKSKTNPETWQQWGIHLVRVGEWMTCNLRFCDQLVILANPIDRKAIETYGQMLGVVRIQGMLRDCSLTEMRDMHVKAVMAGHGRASKEEMIAKAGEIWPGVEWDEHTADAALAAECVRRGR